ncbi:MAG: cation:proton antiporter [Planctomycetota bacterium]
MRRLTTLFALSIASIAQAAESNTADAVAPASIPAALDVPGLDIAMWIFYAILAVSLALTFIRVARGPSVPDRIVALDVMGNLCAVTIALTAIATGQPILLAIALVIALIMFLGTTAFSLYLERRTES